jgi:glycerol-3-phosphate dehydrogenase
VAIPPFDRETNLRRLKDETFDVLVIGGGITGAGVALDAAARGLRVALVERDDFASGTSSKSSKLVHGGLRYLQQGEYRLVYEALAERQVLLQNAPHLVRVLPFLIPILQKDGLINKKLARALGVAMWMYDLTGGLRVGKRHQRISKEVALAHMPTLPAGALQSAYLYYDCRTDDARLVVTVLRTAAAHGATVVNRAGVVEILNESGHVCGARVQAVGHEAPIEIRAKTVVNAAGVWADDVRSLDEGVHPHSIRPAKGIHLTVPWSLVRNDIAAIVPIAKDKRSIFVVPWGELTYIGTTDTDYDGPLDDPQCTADDVAYLLDAMNALRDRDEPPLTTADVVGTWAGLRPLLKRATTGKTADLSRRHAVQISAHGVVTITGGKLTTYRRMAADTVDAIVKQLGRSDKSTTKKIRLLGAAPLDRLQRDGITEHLATRYGSEATAITDLIDADATLGLPLVPGLPYRMAEAVYAARFEMAQTLDDVLSRRTRARLLARDASVHAAPAVAAVIATELGWDDTQRDVEVAAYRAAIDEERSAAHLPETALDQQLGA